MLKHYASVIDTGLFLFFCVCFCLLVSNAVYFNSYISQVASRIQGKNAFKLTI